MARGEEAQIAVATRGRQTNPMQMTDAALEKAVAGYIDRYFKHMMGDFKDIREKLATLNGDVGSDAAMRRPPIEQMVSQIPAQPKCRESAAPTADDYNALVKDVHALYAGMAALRFALQS